jgi:hypothetical protein
MERMHAMAAIIQDRRRSAEAVSQSSVFAQKNTLGLH